ncbi:type IV secretory system conjugative DNA transfer family protein [Pseudonocardia abyssalis]|uniref:TraM recognition domain-containing protein n=1 Tax=Pseudonocardia abyssalis TaxID=2792008 RepID=A0ABS6URP4_9PSEU|nr:type IV secretory system conjugative DNA transfer family protein [Pseudonocardia abyssalis]MBW0113826.1 TraM recognition domain-containing protein [Pseudonocardia abyssalis]MBW0134932.1 TraM recognition domain-containing protein [Pseudonocardia abyssalis]
MNRALLRDAAAPLLLLSAIGAAALLCVDVWLAAGLASLSGTGTWVADGPDPLTVSTLLRDGPAAILSPDASTTVFATVLSTAILLEATAVVLIAFLLTGASSADDPQRSLLGRRELGDLSGDAAAERARRLRPSLDGDEPADRGLRLLSIGRRDVWMSWEDVGLVVMGPRANKTSALAVPTVLAAPGLVVATSNKADLWALTSGLRGRAGPVWTFDPQLIAHARQTWWWDPLRSIRDVEPAERMEAASRLAGHFMGTIGGNRRDPFFHSAAEQVLTSTLLAAALQDGGTVRDVVSWLQPGSRDAVAALDAAGALVEAADLESTLHGADVTTKGILQTARTATKALTSERILRWITPPHTWLSPPVDPPIELDMWDLLRAAQDGRATVHLLSKEGAGTAAPVVTALVDRILEAAELLAQARGGRLDPPVVAVLDEAANICPIRQLPQLYSHYGSRGIQVLTMLQSYQQGVGVWGEQGMQALWSAATIKVVGAGVDDHAFLQRLSGLIGDHDVEKTSTSIDRTRGASRQYSTAREPILPASVLRALPRDQAVLLATGRRAGLGRLHPWYRERDNTDISGYADIALEELCRAAAIALGPHNPVNLTRGTP